MTEKRAGKRGYTPEDKERLRQLRAAGKLDREVAAELGRTTGSVRAMAGVLKLKRRTSKWAGREARLIEMLADGARHGDIAQAFGCSTNAVSCHVAELKRRGQGVPRARRFERSVDTGPVDTRRVGKMMKLSARIAFLRKWAERAA